MLCCIPAQIMNRLDPASVAVSGRGPESCWLYSVQLGDSTCTEEQRSHNLPLQSSNELYLYYPCGFDSLTTLPQSDASVTQ